MVLMGKSGLGPGETIANVLEKPYIYMRLPIGSLAREHYRKIDFKICSEDIASMTKVGKGVFTIFPRTPINSVFRF